MLGREAKRDGQGAAGRRRPPVRSLLVIVLLLSLGLVAVTMLNYRTAVRVADETLQNQGVAISLE